MGAMSIAVGESTSQVFAGFIAKTFGFNVSFICLASMALLGNLFFTSFMPETKERGQACSCKLIEVNLEVWLVCKFHLQLNSNFI